MSKPSPVTFDSTLANVLSHDFEVSSITLGQVVAQNFAQNPDLPGVIVTDNSHLLGMISRTQFREKIHHSQQKDFYLNNPIQLLLDYIRTPPLLLPPDCKLIDATTTILNRNKELIYEPIIVVFEKNQYRLIDVQEILLAQNKLIYSAQNQINQQQSKITQCFKLLEIEQTKFKNYFHYSKKQQENLKKFYENYIEFKQKEWLKSIQEINQINQEFKSISQLVVSEISQAFSSIFMSTNFINDNNKPVFDLNQSISRDLGTIHSASNLISDILKQIRHLVVKVSIIVHRTPSSLQGYSKINSEINKMINEIINCNQQINKTTNNFKFHVQKMQDITQNNEETTRSIFSKIQRGEMVIRELEQLMNQEDSSLTSLLDIPTKNIPSDHSESLKLEPEPIIETSWASKHPPLSSNSKQLLQIIERTLKKQKPSSLV